jgi:hypothetical protein
MKTGALPRVGKYEELLQHSEDRAVLEHHARELKGRKPSAKKPMKQKGGQYARA